MTQPALSADVDTLGFSAPYAGRVVWFWDKRRTAFSDQVPPVLEPPRAAIVVRLCPDDTDRALGIVDLQIIPVDGQILMPIARSPQSDVPKYGHWSAIPIPAHPQSVVPPARGERRSRPSPRSED
jgi:hypothetical protein